MSHTKMNLNERREESEILDLKFMWNRHPHEFLASYLLAGEQHPFHNPQHFAVRAILKDVIASHNPGFSTPLERFVERVFLRVYAEFWRPTAPRPKGLLYAENFFLTLGKRAQARMATRAIKKISILDVGCGSANYFASFRRAGLESFLTYTGVDIAEKNIENCRMLYPEIDARVGDVSSLEFPDAAFDVVLVSRVFEYLPLRRLEKAISEIMRVAKETAIINFFCEREAADHHIRKILRYYRNCLSREKLKAFFRPYAKDLAIIDRYEPFGRGKQVCHTDRRGNPVFLSTWVVKIRGSG